MTSLKSYPVSSLFKYRDRVTIIRDILKTVRNSRYGRRKTQIMQSANLNYFQTKKYLRYLIERGFLVVTEGQKYIITAKGSRFLLSDGTQRL